jgi:hypothetical protein
LRRVRLMKTEAPCMGMIRAKTQVKTLGNPAWRIGNQVFFPEGNSIVLKRRLKVVYWLGATPSIGICDKYSPYLPEHANWTKIRNRDYSQWAGREEWFERERGSDHDFRVWDQCALVVLNDMSTL